MYKDCKRPDVGVKGSLMVSFQIGSCSFTYRFIVCKGITRPLILGEDFLSHHCFKLGWTDDKKGMRIQGKVIAIASQVVMDDRIMVSRPVLIPARHFAIVPTKCPNMFTGRVEACPCQEFQNKFPISMSSQCNTITLTASGQKTSCL